MPKSSFKEVRYGGIRWCRRLKVCARATRFGAPPSSGPRTFVRSLSITENLIPPTKFKQNIIRRMSYGRRTQFSCWPNWPFWLAERGFHSPFSPLSLGRPMYSPGQKGILHELRGRTHRLCLRFSGFLRIGGARDPCSRFSGARRRSRRPWRH